MKSKINIKIKNSYKMYLHKGAFNNYVDKKGGRGGSAKSPRLSTQGGGGSLDVHVDKKLKENYRRIMANDHEKSYYTSSFRCMQYIKDD